MIEKLDKKLFEISEKITLRGVYKSKHKEHKFHIQKRIFNWFVASFLGAIFVFPIMCLVFGLVNIIQVATMLVWLPVGILFTWEYKLLKRDIERHDTFWGNRKNPMVYQGVKEALESLFEDREMKMLRYSRLGMHFFSMGMFILLSAVLVLNIATLLMNIWLIAQCFYHIYDIYTMFVFDFDPPDKKEDKKEVKMTDLLKAQWTRALGASKA